MHKFFEELERLLTNVVSDIAARDICLSGGLDSSVIAFLLKNKKVRATTIICKDFLATDLTYCQIIANKFEIPLEIKHIGTDELLSATEDTIKILKNFNDIEIRNAVVIYLALRSIKQQGKDEAITGDGADELFAGYKFFSNMSQKDLQNNLTRIREDMHFPTNEIGKALNVKVETPFLDEQIINFAKNLPVNLLIRNEGDKKYGKWILRKTFEKKLPKSIIWREKSPMQDGAGTKELTNLFESLVSDQDFEQSKKQIQKSDNVIIRTKESLHYYNIFKKYYSIPSKLNKVQTKCPFCNYQTEKKTKFCRMCGSFPI